MLEFRDRQDYKVNRSPRSNRRSGLNGCWNSGIDRITRSTGVQGQIGDQGLTGAGIQGSTGLQGPTGDQGSTGLQGCRTGDQGSTGIQGSIGDQGLTGVQGFAGSGPQDVSINTVPIAIDSSDWANSVIYQDSTAGLILTINPINELNLSSANISINGLQQCTMSTVDNSGFFQIISDGTAIISAPIIMFPNLPVIPGPSGSLWNNDGTLMIAS